MGWIEITKRNLYTDRVYVECRKLDHLIKVCIVVIFWILNRVESRKKLNAEDKGEWWNRYKYHHYEERFRNIALTVLYQEPSLIFLYFNQVGCSRFIWSNCCWEQRELPSTYTHGHQPAAASIRRWWRSLRRSTSGTANADLTTSCQVETTKGCTAMPGSNNLW